MIRLNNMFLYWRYGTCYVVVQGLDEMVTLLLTRVKLVGIHIVTPEFLTYEGF